MISDFTGSPAADTCLPRSPSCGQLHGLQFLPEEGDKTTKKQYNKGALFDQGVCQLFLGDLLPKFTHHFSNKALLFVERLLGEINTFSDPWTVSAVFPKQCLVNRIQCLLRLQMAFRQAGKPVEVDIGYHYTSGASLASIKRYGLLTRAGRYQLQLRTCTNNGSQYGDGVYTADDAFSYNCFAPDEHGHGILVLRLKGVQELRFSTNEFKEKRGEEEEGEKPDTIRARMRRDQDAVVLRRSDQCVALVQFPKHMVDTSNDDWIGNAILHHYHQRLQLIVDDIFNNGSRTHVPRRLASDRYQPLLVYVHRKIQRYFQQYWSATTMESLTEAMSQLTYHAPHSLQNAFVGASWVGTQPLDDWSPGQICSICWNTPQCYDPDPAAAGIVALTRCNHEFHQSCLNQALLFSTRCPMCRRPIVESQGTMPSGVMAAFRSRTTTCNGYKPGTIIIYYHIFGGTQERYHENPWTSFRSTQRQAYLPDNDDGRQLLKRLKFAFAHGLTFTIGTSLTTGLKDSVVWASIHHKTSTRPGPHGFPDTSYFLNCNEDLDALGVPAAESLA